MSARLKWLSILILLPLFSYGCGSSSKTRDVEEMSTDKQIEWLFSIDKRYSTQMERRINNGVPQGQAISAYVENLHSIDVSPLPQDIRTTFQEHRRAWEKYANTLNSGPQVDLASLMNLGQAFARLKSGDITAITSLLSEMESSEGTQVAKEIDNTWTKLQDLAVNHGASTAVSPYRYPDEKLVSISEVKAEEANWDPDFGGFAAPDIRISVRVDGSPSCFDEGKDSYTFSPDCSFLVRPSSEVKFHIEDDDINQPEEIGRWETDGETLISQTDHSFDKVQRLRIDRE